MRGSVFLDAGLSLPSTGLANSVRAEFTPPSVVFYPGEWNQTFYVKVKLLALPLASRLNRDPRLLIPILFTGDSCDEVYKS